MDLWSWEPQEFSEIEGPLAVQEYIQQVIRLEVGNIDKLISQPLGCDKTTWLYEHTRQFILELNLLVTQLRAYCTSQTCPLMRINTESYRCTVHNELQEVSKTINVVLSDRLHDS